MAASGAQGYECIRICAAEKEDQECAKACDSSCPIGLDKTADFRLRNEECGDGQMIGIEILLIVVLSFIGVLEE